MIITCPNCGTQYFADDSTIGESGRTVKCTACDHSWFVHPQGTVHDPEESADTQTDSAQEAYRRAMTTQRNRQSRAAAILSWLITASIFFMLGAGAVVLRQDVVKIWPASASVYRFAGLEVNRFGLDFTYQEASRTFDGTTPVLTVRGQVKNVSNTIQQTPKVRVSIRDELKRELDHVIADIAPLRLEPGALGDFTAEITNPPVESFLLELSLVELGGPRSRPERPVAIEAAETEEPDTDTEAPLTDTEPAN